MTGLEIMAEKEAKYLSIKIRDDVYRLVKTLASWHNKDVQVYLTEIVEPIAKAEFLKMSKQASKDKDP